MPITTVDFEAAGAAAPNTGTALGSFYAAQSSTAAYRLGLVFSAAAQAFRNDGTGAGYNYTAVPSRHPNDCFLRNDFSQAVTITVEAGYNFDGLTLDYAVASQNFQIVVYSRPDSASVVHTVTRDVNAAGAGFVWTANDVLDLAGAGFGSDAYIDRIVITPVAGFFAIDNLRFTGSGPAVEPAFWASGCQAWPAGTGHRAP